MAFVSAGEVEDENKAMEEKALEARRLEMEEQRLAEGREEDHQGTVVKTTSLNTVQDLTCFFVSTALRSLAWLD